MLFAAASGMEALRDGNAVQVGDRSYENMPIAEIPSDFVSAADALAAGNRLLDAGETERAIDAFLQAVKFDPDLAEAYFKLGIAYSLVESRYRRRGRRTDHDGQFGETCTGRRRTPKKPSKTPSTAYKKLIDQNKDDDVAHFYLGLSYNKLNKDEDAARELREAVRVKARQYRISNRARHDLYQAGQVFTKLLPP